MARSKKPKKAKEENGSLRQEIRHLEMLIEDAHDDIKLIAEQYGDIKQTLDEHGRILKEHTELFVSILTDIEIMKADIEFIKNSLKKKVDVEEFAALERRVALLEKRR